MKISGAEISKALDKGDDLVVLSLCRELIASRARKMNPIGLTTSGRTGVVIGAMREAMLSLDRAVTALDPARPAFATESDIHGGLLADALNHEFSP